MLPPPIAKEVDDLPVGQSGKPASFKASRSSQVKLHDHAAKQKLAIVPSGA